MPKGRKLGLYLNKEISERFEKLKHSRVLVRRNDALGEPYMDEIRIPSSPQEAARRGLELFLDLAESQAVIDETNIDKEK